MKRLDVILVCALLCASLVSTLSVRDKSAVEIERLKQLYRADTPQLIQQVDNCRRYFFEANKSIGGTCDGATSGYATMADGPSCRAAYAVAREKGLLAPEATQNLPLRSSR